MRARSLRRRVLLGVGLALAVALTYVAAVVVRAWVRTPALVAARAPGPDGLRARDLPKEWVEILLAVEDPRFFSHHGIDLTTPGAGMTTITQSLAKELYFARFRPGLAKIAQSLDALVLDRRVDKWAQLDLFVDRVYLGTIDGQSVNGLRAGARTYFHTELTGLTRDEYLALVATIIAPDRLSPTEQPQRNAERVRRIDRMLRGECAPTGLTDVYYAACGS